MAEYDSASSAAAGRSRAAQRADMDPRIARALAVSELVEKHPVVQSASIVPLADGKATVQVRYTSVSRETKSQRKFTQTFVVDENGSKFFEGPLEPLSDEIKFSSTSPSGQWTANFRVADVADDETGTGKKGKSKRTIEIIDKDSGVLEEVDVTDEHADFMSGDHWGQPTWLGQKEQGLAYVAGQLPPNHKDDNKPFGAYEYYPVFGEQLGKQSRPGLFLLDFSRAGESKVSLVSPTEDIVSNTITVFRQPALAPRKAGSDITLFATGSSLLPNGRRLGSIFCYNRPDSIYEITIDASSASVKSTRRISNLDRAARSPRVIQFGSNKAQLFYLSNRRGYEHGSCASLHKRELPLKEASSDSDVLVDTVRKPDEKTGFPGLYSDNLLPSCQLSSDDSNNGQIVIGSAWSSRTALLQIDTKDGQVEVAPSEDITSYTPFATDGRRRIFAVRSSPISPPEVVIGYASGKPDTKIIWNSLKKWSYTFKPDMHFKDITKIFSTIVPLPGRKDTEAIVISGTPLDDSKLANKLHSAIIPGLGSQDASSLALSTPPLILSPHGGPNGQCISSWNSNRCLSLVAAGFSVALFNYPGSTGFGQDTIEELSTACGDLEVRLTVEMREHLNELGIGSEEKGQRLYTGGSHSGFMGAHLAAKYPAAFDAIDIRNPVIDLPSMFATSDIPDWTLAQFDVMYDFEKPPSFVMDERILKTIREASPSYHAEKLFAQHDGPCMPATLLQIGDSDKRVPPTQGIAWYHALKGHGEDVKMLWYPGNNHSLSETWTTPKTLEATLDFFIKHSRF